MEEKTIRKYAGLMKELDLSGLEISENGQSIRLERGSAAILQSPAAAVDVADEPLKTTSLSLIITSPMVGVFYSAAAENQPPFVSVGQSVNKGDVVCVIESMKLMNEIVSEYDGIVEEIYAQNQQEVDYGHILFKLTPQ